ncbi:MAG: ROK family transcriptional regulator [Clostridiales bacterium]|jgi:predicted NBD/HSP70 family sugar kinase/biotin operon repressor|nr:ROK family transcriptional regulator [Clostridiales bacterium]
MKAQRKTLSITDIKLTNARGVLKCLKGNEQISRAGISRATGLSRPTVSVLIAELIDKGCIIECGDGEAHSGRKPIILKLNRAYKYAIGLDYSSSRFIRGCVCDMAYGIIAKAERPCDASRGCILEITSGLIDELLQHIPAESSLAGIGIGVTGIVDTVKNRVIESERYDLNINYAGYLQDRYAAPIFMENDSNVAAVAEYAQGKARGKENFIYIFCSEVIGMGIFLKGSLFYGNMFNSGEIIHMAHDGITETCGCGNKGCLGVKLSESNIISQINNGDKKVNTMRQVYNLYHNYHPQTEAAVNEAAKYLSRLIANTSKLLGIDDFVIGGFFTGFGERFLRAVSEYVKQEHVGFRSNAINIQFSKFLEDGVALGAASLVLDKVWDLSL